MVTPAERAERRAVARLVGAVSAVPPALLLTGALGGAAHTVELAERTGDPAYLLAAGAVVGAVAVPAVLTVAFALNRGGRALGAAATLTGLGNLWLATAVSGGGTCDDTAMCTPVPAWADGGAGALYGLCGLGLVAAGAYFLRTGGPVQSRVDT